MAKKEVTIRFDRLNKNRAGKDKLINFRVEEKLHADFKSFCETKMDNLSVSDALRSYMRALLAQNGYKIPLAHTLIRRTLLALNA